MGHSFSASLSKVVPVVVEIKHSEGLHLVPVEEEADDHVVREVDRTQLGHQVHPAHQVAQLIVAGFENLEKSG